MGFRYRIKIISSGDEESYVIQKKSWMYLADFFSTGRLSFWKNVTEETSHLNALRAWYLMITQEMEFKEKAKKEKISYVPLPVSPDEIPLESAPLFLNHIMPPVQELAKKVLERQPSS